MGQLRLAPASPLDFLDALDDGGVRHIYRTRPAFAEAARQVAASTGVTVKTDDGELVLVAGLQPLGDEALALWFAPGAAMRRHVVSAVLGIRRRSGPAAGDVAPCTVKAATYPGGVAGPRLLRLCGFEATGLLESARGPVTVWTRRFA